MRRDFFVYLVLLVGGLGLAYYISLPTDKGETDKTEWVKINPKTVTKISYRSKDANVSIERQGQDDAYWVVVENLKVDTEEPKPGKKPEEKIVAFKANAKLADFLQEFNPLYAERVIGKLEDAQLEKFGFKEPTTFLDIEVDREGAPLKLVFGKKAYGSRNVYVRDESSGKVFLFADKEISNLASARSRLFEDRFFKTDLQEITAAELTAGDKSKSILHRKKEGSGEFEWVDRADDKVKASYQNYMGKIDKLRVIKYANEEEGKLLDAVSPFLVLKLKKGEDEVAVLSFKKFKAPGTEEEGFWAHSSVSNHHGRMITAKGDAIEKDLQSLLNE